MSSSTTLEVKESDIVKTRTVKNVQIRVQELVLGTKVVLTVSLLDTVGHIIDNVPMTLSGADYELWGTDDTYINTYVLTQLGLVLA
jgi:hypothetical protein